MVLGQRRRRGCWLARVLIVDDTPARARRNSGNAIPPSEYLGAPGAQELRRRRTYLLRRRNEPDPRLWEKRHWRRDRTTE
jgi:hypothetical protein